MLHYSDEFQHRQQLHRFQTLYFVLLAVITSLPKNKTPITQAQVVLHFINSNIRVLNVQRTSPMRIAFTVLANTERSSTRGTQSKSPGDRNIYQELQKEEAWPKRHKIKCCTTFSRHRDRLESLLWRCVCVCLCACMCVCVTWYDSLIQNWTEVLIDILNTNIKVSESQSTNSSVYGGNTAGVSLPGGGSGRGLWSAVNEKKNRVPSAP